MRKFLVGSLEKLSFLRLVDKVFGFGFGFAFAGGRLIIKLCNHKNILKFRKLAGQPAQGRFPKLRACTSFLIYFYSYII